MSGSVVTGDPLTTTAIARRGDGELTLFDCLRAFVRYPSPQVLSVAVVLAIGVHVAFGHWQWQDAAAGFLLLCFQPFSEWLIHVGLLHSKPFKIGRVTVDLPTARLHRWHHRNPTVIEGVLIPGRLVAIFLVLLLPVMWLLSWPWVLTGASHIGVWMSLMIASCLLIAAYEWCHFIIHTPYRPKTTYYQSIWRTHRLHHFKNEHFWFGVSSDAADRVLGTFPDQKEVPKSRTVRELLGDRGGAPAAKS